MKKIKIPFTNKVIVDEKFLIENECYKKAFGKLDLVVETVFMGGQCSYIVYEGISLYAVCLQIDNYLIPIKSFPFGGDKEYAKLCAEELCEMLKNN